MLNIVCHDVQVEPVLQELTGEVLTRGTNQAPDARLDVYARGFWERQGSAFFDVGVFHQNAESYKDLTITKISPFSSCIVNMRMRRGCTQTGFLKSSKGPLLL